MIPPVTFTRGFAQTGTHTKQVAGLKGRDLVSPDRVQEFTSGTFLTLIAWSPDPRNPNRWLRVRAEHRSKPDAPPEDREPFAAMGPGVLGAELRLDSEVYLTFEILTDGEAYCQAVEAEPRTIRRRLIVGAAQERDGRRYESQIPVELTVTDASPMPTYQGFVALDLGNTSSTLVCRSSDMNAPPEINLVPTRELPGAPAEPATSALRIVKLRRPPESGQYTACDYQIGDDALAGNPPVDSLFLGAKRLLSDQAGLDAPDKVDFMLNGAAESLGRTEPAELFVAKMLQSFHRLERSFPDRLGLTCPTTFSRHEVEQLRIAAYHGGRRSRGVNPRPSSPSGDDLDGYVPWVIDEASAAAFYFVHDEFLERPGRVAGFRYIYPRGMNLLLYDCGGGTTDIALVHVEVGESDSDQFVVRFEVLGRAGHRNFGGDAMTIAAFRLLKVKLAAVLDGTSVWPSPGDLKELRRFLTEGGKVAEVDRCLRTAFHAELDDPSLPETRERKEATLLLWQVAERAKRRLAEAAAGKGGKGHVEISLDGQVHQGGGASQGAAKTDPAMTQKEFQRLSRVEDNSRLTELWQKAQQIRISTAEVDWLLDADVRESVRYARCLIESRLPRDQEVHWVYVVGNASRYPLIRRAILDAVGGLPIRFLEERLRKVAPADLKNSVAKGAVRVMQVRERHEDYWVRFDEKLMERLPFDIQRKGAGALERLLFKENTLYDDLLPRDIVIEPPKEGQAATREVVLSRVWPGDNRGEEYIRFRTGRPGETFRGSYRIEYDRHNHRFKMRKLDDDGEPFGETFVGMTQEVKFRNAPVQVGERAWPPVQA
ncbi:acetate and sugar kinases/Hsc70/actin family protein [Tautonia plasticadhaerens]|uniref:Chaperone protein DnaK n=1 Tax=Tautonia plasticadhaerens TaxID=2527974 RepID=A0A518H648_9BACT|nr:hypothetical protein [Tautonia plasticadhaerens]QDV36298.1 hypothetical protein ElP_42180 [Tautonia plasticadhaerens]